MKADVSCGGAGNLAKWNDQVTQTVPRFANVWTGSLNDGEYIELL